jgi:transcription antitermination factor NusG
MGSLKKSLLCRFKQARTSMTGPNWYAVRTRSRAEKVVREHLRRRGIETFLALLSKISRWKDRLKRIEWPLFPGYCFARFTLEEKLLVLQSPGIVGIVGSAASRPEPIPDEEITALQRVMISGRSYGAQSALQEGALIEIVRGPLIGIRGRLVKTGNRSRIIVAVNLISQGAVVDVEIDDIVPIPLLSMPREAISGQ